MDKVFQALAHKDRREILDRLKAHPGMSVGELSGHFSMSRIGVMKHIGVLEQALLIHSRKQGRTRQLYFNPVPIRQIYQRWTDTLSDTWSEGILGFKDHLESIDTHHAAPVAHESALT